MAQVRIGMAVIFGYIGEGEAGAPSGALLAMRAALAYATPHGVSLRHGLGWGIAQALTAADAQPRRSVAHDAPFVADALLADPAGLSARLGVASTAPASALLQAGFQRWGDRLGQHATGAWSIASFEPHAKTLTIIRDALGLRPVYVAHGPRWMAFSSEVEALSALPGVGTALDPVGIAGAWFDEVGWDNPEATALRDVRAVPAGHVWRLTLGGSPVSQRYWRMEPVTPLVFADARQAVDAFREAMGDAVSASLRDAVNPGLMLSGGIDSGAVLAAAGGFAAGPVHGLRCISVVTELAAHGLDAEVANIRQLVAAQPDPLVLQIPLPARRGHPDAADGAEVAWGFHHPRDASALVPGLAYRAAAQAGMDVVLDGIDGDLVTAATKDAVASRLALGQWRAAWREASEGSHSNPYMRGIPPLRLMLQGGARALMPEWGRRLRAHRDIPAKVASAGLARPLLLSADIEGRVRAAYARLPRDPHARHLALLAHRLSASLCSMRHVAMRRGIDARHPWAHLPFVQFLQSLPNHWRTRDGWTKYLVRLSCEATVGTRFAWHSGKSHVGVAMTRALVRDAAPYLRTLVSERREVVASVLDSSVIEAALSCLEAPDEGGDADNALQVAAMAGWLQDSPRVRG